MSVFLTPLLAFLQAYGYPVLWLSMFIASVGAPLPITLVLLAAGAFSAQGDFNVVTLLIVSLTASIAGDCVGYLIGRLWGGPALEWLARSRLGRRLVTPRALERSRNYFQRHGGWAIILTRVLLSALGSVTNLVAGAEVYPFSAFLLYDAVGEAIGVVMLLMAGFVVGASWEAVGDLIGAISLFALGLLGVIVIAWRFIRSLRGKSAHEGWLSLDMRERLRVRWRS